MNKKVSILIIGLISLLFPSSVLAGGACDIADGQAPELTEYIQNIRKIVSNVSSELNSSKPSSLNKGKAKLIKAFNIVTTWNGYGSTFRFYVTLPLTTLEVPYEIKRDHSVIQKEIEGLGDFLSNIIKKGSSNSIIDDACSGVNIENCNLNGKSAEYIIGELLKDVTNLGDAYRLSILGDDYDYINIKFGGNNFKQIWNYYNSAMLSNCSQEGGFGERINKAIKEVGLTSKAGQDGIKLWQDAIDLMTGNVSNYNSVEKELLKKELSRQGVSQSNSEAVLGNLEKYNKTGGFSKDNNFIENSFEAISKNIGTQLKEFKKDVLTFEKDERENQETLQKSIKDIVKLGEKNDITVELTRRVAEAYNNELIFAQVQDTNTQKLQTKLIDMHANIVSAINTLEKIIPISEKVCNDQDNGEGLCSTD